MAHTATELHKVKRALLRLRQATIADLAAHSGVTTKTVEGFLAARPGIVSWKEGSVMSTTGQQEDILTLLPESETTLLNELRQEQGTLWQVGDCELMAERTQAEDALRASIKKNMVAIEHLRKRNIKNEEARLTKERIRKRIYACRIAIRDLDATGDKYIGERWILDLMERMITTTVFLVTPRRRLRVKTRFRTAA
jgi:hypothetical protein